MDVLLVEPPSTPEPILPLHAWGRQPSHGWSPPWSLECLRSFITRHTRHLCRLIDCRLFSDLESDLTQAIEACPSPRIIVVNTETESLGEASAVLEIAKRHFPDTKTVICGSYPSQHPDRCMELPRVDYALSGDPEIILRNLLDYLDVPRRLRHVPGLITGDSPEKHPSWVGNVKRLTLGTWDDIVWAGYRAGVGDDRAVAITRLSRGHTGLPCDKAFGNVDEPFRIWPLNQIAEIVQRCAHLEISEVFLDDPPGVWTPERLTAWCDALDRIRNLQPWGFRILPAWIDDDEAEALARAKCRHLEILFPSCEPSVLETYGCILSYRELDDSISLLESLGIHVHLTFWMGGPEEPEGEAERILRALQKLSPNRYTISPFPLSLDSPLYRQSMEQARIPHLEDWLEWSLRPWTAERPVPLWGGQEQLNSLRQEMEEIERSLNRNLRYRFQRWTRSLGSRNWIDSLEQKALSLIIPTR